MIARVLFSLVILFFFGLTPIMFLILEIEEALFLFINSLPSLVLLGAIIYSKKQDWFSPLLFVFINVFLGITLRSILMVFNKANYAVRVKFYIDQDLNFFIWPSVIIAISLFCFVIGYSINFKSPPKKILNTIKLNNWRQLNVHVVIILLFTVGLIFTLLFLQKTQFVGFNDSFTIADISKKRFVDIGGKKAAFGYYRWMASLLQLAFYLYLARFAKRRTSFVSIQAIFLGILASCALIFPILTNSRAGVVLSIIGALMIWYYIRGINLRTLAVSMSVSIVLIMILTLSRKRQLDDLNSVYSHFSMMPIIEAVAGARHYLGVAKTAHIMDAVPDELSYAYGRTFVGWLVAPIPREMWHGKPSIGLGPTIVDKALHGDYSRSGGVPPGFLGELYWNFGILGMIIGMFLFGMVLKSIYCAFLPYLHSSISHLMLYIPICMGLSFYLPNGSVNDGVLHMLKGIIPVLTVLFLINLKITSNAALTSNE